MGDVFYVIVFFYGQGMNFGFEDCILFDEFIDVYDGNWMEIIEVFNYLWIKDVNVIVDFVLCNFIEMWDKVVDFKFLLCKEIVVYFNKIYLEFLLFYLQVIFSYIFYSEVLEEGYVQDVFFEEILVLDGIEYNWKDNFEVDCIFRKWMQGCLVLVIS